MIMKKILLMAAFAVATLAANAQSYVGGTLGFTKLGDAQTIKVLPEVGTAISDNLGIGIALGYTNVKDTYNQINVNPYVRYQALQIGQWNIFVDGGVYFNYKKNEGADKADTQFGLNVAPGLAFKLSDSFSIVAKANNLFCLDFFKAAGADDTKIDANLSTVNNFSFGGLSFGFYYTF